MLYRLFRTTPDATIAILRLVLGIVFFAHGAQKALGWWGGGGYSGTMQFFTQQLNIPPFFAMVAIAAEFIGGIALIAGFLGRIAALAIIVQMIVAVVLVHLPYGFFMNWQGSKPGEGFEYHLLAMALGLAVLVKGSGRWSVDLTLNRRLNRGAMRGLPRQAA